jgi:anti-sigma factor RsiW
MTTRISPRDWEALSAYLDGQLSPKERDRLEKRLRLSADLRAAMEDLRRTRALLRSQPRLKAPRNFTLTPEMVGRSAPRRRLQWSPSSLSPALNLVSALAGLLFVVILVTDLLNLGPAGIPMAAQPAAKQAATEQVALMAEPQAALETSEAQPMEAPAAVAPAAESQAFSPTGTPGTGASPPAAESNLAYPGSTAEAGGDFPTTSAAEAIPVPTEPELQAQRAAQETYPPAAIEEPTESQAADSSAAAETPAETTLNFGIEWRALEIALAVIALAAGLAAFWLRRSGSL